jgi:hypothetical protein
MTSLDFIVRINPFSGIQEEVPAYDEISIFVIDFLENLRSGETKEKFPMKFIPAQSSSEGVII